MNDDPTSSTAGTTQPPAEASSSNHGPTAAIEPQNGETAHNRLRNRMLMQAKKKAELIGDIMQNLDMVIYAELSIMYYLDNSFFRLLIRSLFQVMFLTPKPSVSNIRNTTKHHPYIGAIFVPNLFCIFIHLLTRRPSAGEAARGYLHGSVILDFIGQKGPTSKFHLVALDLLILSLQCFMLTVHVEQERLKLVLSDTATVNITPPTAAVIAAQTLDEEERGVLRNVVTASGDIEMHSMLHTHTQTHSQTDTQGRRDDEENEEREHLLSEADPRADGEAEDGPLDVFYSGNVVVADFHVLHTLRSQWRDHDTASATALQTVGHTAGYNWTRMQNRLARLEGLR